MLSAKQAARLGRVAVAIVALGLLSGAGEWGSTALGGAGLRSALGGGSAVLAPAKVTGDGLLFSLPLDTSGVSNLTTDLTINGTTVAADFAYRGQDATTSAWTALVGDDLPKDGSGAFDVSQPAPFTDGTECVKLPSGANGYGSAAANTSFPGTNDFVLELVAQISPNAGEAYLVGRYVTAQTPNWLFYTVSGGTLRLAIHDGTASVTVSLGSALTKEAWQHIMLFVDRDGGASAYVNGVLAGSSASFSTAQDSLTREASKFLVGNFEGSSNGYNAKMAWVAGWQSAGWLDAHTQAAVAKERAAKLFGLIPAVAKGTAVPSTMTRTTASYLDIDDEAGVRNLHYVGNNWLRIAKRKEKTGGEFLTGFLSEAISTNRLLQSQAFDIVSWTKSEATVNANESASPAGGATVDGIAASSVAGAHYVEQAATLTAATYVLSVFAKAGDRDWLYLENSTVANANAYFDLANGALGTKGAGATEAFIENYGNGWYRCAISFTGTAASHTLRIYAAEADTDNIFTGDDSTTSVSLWGAQVEAHAFPTTYIPTTTATATRNGDDIRYDASGNVPTNGIITALGSVLAPDHAAARDGTLMRIRDAGGANYLFIRAFKTDQTCSFIMANGGIVQINGGPSGDRVDGEIQTYRMVASENDATLYAGSDTATDNSCTIPTNWTSILCVGGDLGVSQPNGLVANVKIWEKRVLP